jgi:hypothetical protein
MKIQSKLQHANGWMDRTKLNRCIHIIMQSTQKNHFQKFCEEYFVVITLEKTHHKQKNKLICIELHDF